MIGDRIKIARKNAEMTQDELGKAIGLSGVAIMRYEKGQREPNKSVIESIAKVLGVNPNFLMDWDELYPNIAKDVEKHNHFAMYMKSLGFDVVYNTEPSMISMEDVPEQFREDLEGDFIEGETFTITVMYEGEPLILSEEDFNELQKSTSECIEHQLWKIKKNQEK